jgi:DNA-binding transcriptional regulator YdaS (Cro superfamily)
MQEKMTLDEWLKKKKISSTRMSHMIGCTEATMSNWRTGKRKPDRRYQMMIEKATKGEVVYE